jgi:hypothetical protein
LGILTSDQLEPSQRSDANVPSSFQPTAMHAEMSAHETLARVATSTAEFGIVDQVAPFHSIVRGIPSFAPTTMHDPALRQSTSYGTMTSLEDGSGREDHAEPSQRSTKIRFVGGRKPIARQNVLLEQDTDPGCPDVAGFSFVGTGRFVCAHVDPFHSSAGAVPLG